MLILISSNKWGMSLVNHSAGQSVDSLFFYRYIGFLYLNLFIVLS